MITVVDLHNRSIVSGPEIQARGLAEDDSVFKEAKQRFDFTERWLAKYRPREADLAD